MNRRLVLSIHLLSTILFAPILLLLNYSHPNSQLLISISCFLIVAELAWMLFSWTKLTGEIFNPYGLFISMVALTHGSVPLLTMISLTPNYQGYTYDWVSSIPRQAVTSGYLLIALSCYFVHLGACSAPKTPIFLSGNYRSSICIVGWILILLSIIPFVITARTLLSSQENIGYLAYFEASKISTWALNGARFLPVGAFFLFAAQKKFSWSGAASILLIFAYSLTYFIVGARNRWVFTLVILAFLMRMKRIKISRWVLLFCAITILIMAPLLSSTRLDSGTQITEAWTMLGGLRGVIVAAMSELGLYSNIVTTTVATFPAHMHFTWGYSYLVALYFVVPNFFSPRGRHFGVDLGWKTWLADTYYPKYVARGEGFGTGYSFIAEAYESFGYFGIPFIMFIVGYFVAYLSNASRSEKELALAFTASILTELLFYPRDGLYIVSRPIVWYGAIPVALVYLVSAFRKERPYANLTG
jgi:oligosaccharide repeat unit polymerase